MHSPRTVTLSLFTTGSIARRRAAFGAGTLPIFLSSLGCTGDEDNLVMCSGLGPGVNCRHSEDAGVICTGRCGCVCVYI